MRLLILLLVLSLVPSCQEQSSKDWALGTFERSTDARPIIYPLSHSSFTDPITGESVRWESMATFNPAAIVKDGKITLIYRAEEKLGDKEIGGHRSRLGMATSTDGLIFERSNVPFFYPDNDDQYEYEWPGGTEDPRIVESPDGIYIMTYTQWNRQVPRLAIASSKDLINWEKHGPIFKNWKDGVYHNVESKSGAIVTELKDGRLIAARINGRYWMYYGVPHIWLASSEDLIHWEPLENHDGVRIAVLSPRPGFFDSWLVEAGPPPVLTKNGIVVIYNAGNMQAYGEVSLGHRAYSGGQALFEAEEPWKLIDRLGKPFIKPELEFEKSGQYVDGTTFLEGLVYHNDRWFLYYGTADSMVGVCVSKE